MDILYNDKNTDNTIDKINDRKDMVNSKKPEFTESSSSKTKNSKSSNTRTKKKRNKVTKAFEHVSDAYHLAEIFWAFQINKDPKVHPELQRDSEKLELTLQKWAKQFDSLLTKQQPSIEEVEDVILFVFECKYCIKARYSAGYLVQNYLAIRDMMNDMNKNSSNKSSKHVTKDIYPEITKEIKQSWTGVTRQRRFDENDIEKIKSASVKLMSFYKFKTPTSNQIELAVEELFDALRTRYWDKSDIITCGYLCSNTTWDKLMPQHLKRGNIPEETTGNISAKSTDDFDEAVVDDKRESRKITANLKRQNPDNTNDDTIPGFNRLNNM